MNSLTNLQVVLVVSVLGEVQRWCQVLPEQVCIWIVKYLNELEVWILSRWLVKENFTRIDWNSERPRENKHNKSHPYNNGRKTFLQNEVILWRRVRPLNWELKHLQPSVSHNYYNILAFSIETLSRKPRITLCLMKWRHEMLSIISGRRSVSRLWHHQ